jgi:serine/threonine protein kinase
MEPAERMTERYELLGRIASGGMAEVFRARASGAHGFEKLVALKRILPALAAEPDFERRFIVEARIAVGLQHSNIVQVFDFGRVDRSLFLVMELIDGLDLDRLLRACRARGRPLPVPAAMHVAVELAKGLEFAHLRGVVHRDLSPSNVLASRAGEVKLADFGIAVASDPAAQAHGQVAGKWPYMSPEQTEGRPLDARSDLFSAGVVLHELFTGQALFRGADPIEVAEQVRRMPIAPPSSVRRDLPRAIDAVVLRALERAPEARWASAGDLLRALVEAAYAAQLAPTPTELARVVVELAGAA